MLRKRVCRPSYSKRTFASERILQCTVFNIHNSTTADQYR